MKNKLLKSFNDLKKIRAKEDSLGLCHGVFDILHEGHILHIKECKSKSKKLVVSLTEDKFVKKGPNQPINDIKKRVSLISALEFVDYVFINKNLTAEKVIKNLKPDFYFKGKDYFTGDLTRNLGKEADITKKNGGKLILTNTKMMSSSKILNNHLADWSEEQKKYLKTISNSFSIGYIERILKLISELEISIIGEIIIDKYNYVSPQGLTSKDPALSMLNRNKEIIPGGVIAIAKIVSKFVRRVNLITAGEKQTLKTIKNIKNIHHFNLDSTIKTQIKTRYINSNRSEKILQITNFKNYKKQIKLNKINKKRLKNYLGNHFMICDYGIGLFSNNIISFLESLPGQKYLNVQSNSLNLGFNPFTKYKKFNYLCLDRREWELGLKTQNVNTQLIDEFTKKIKQKTAFTDGKFGSTIFNSKKSFYSPVFISKTVDTTGCGDAYFALTTLLLIVKADIQLIPFLGNVYAGMHSQFEGNRDITDKVTFLKYVKGILNF